MLKTFFPLTLDVSRWPFWLTLYAALIGGNYMLFHMVLAIRISFHIVATLFIVVFLIRRGLPNSPLVFPALLMALAVVLAIPGAVDTRMALENAWNWIINLLALLCFIHLCREGREASILRAHFVAGGLVAAAALIQFMLTGERPPSLFLNISITGAYVAALIVPAIHEMTAHRPDRPGTSNSLKEFLRYLAFVVLLVGAVIVGQNRGAFLSVGVAVLVYLSLMVKHFGLKLFFWAGGALALCSVLIILSAQPQHANGDNERLDLWRAGGEMIQAHDFGVGPGLFAQAYYQIGTSGENRFADAHNQVITLGAEIGAPGLAAGAVMLLIVLYCLFGVALDSRQKAVLAALVGAGAHLMVDSFPSDNWAWLVAFYVALVLHGAHFSFPRRVLKPVSIWAALTVLAFGWQLLQFDRAQYAYEIALRTGRYYDAYDATRLDPAMKLYQLELQHLGGNTLSIPEAERPTYGLVMYGRLFR